MILGTPDQEIADFQLLNQRSGLAKDARMASHGMIEKLTLLTRIADGLLPDRCLKVHREPELERIHVIPECLLRVIQRAR